MKNDEFITHNSSLKMSTDTTEKGLEAHISQYLHGENKYALIENKE